MVEGDQQWNGKRFVRCGEIWSIFYEDSRGASHAVKGEVTFADMCEASCGLPSCPLWLIVAKNVLTDEIKYFVSNASAGTPLEELLRVAFSRWHIERCFQDEKSFLGMDHFECRRYVAIRRHLVITAISHLFLSEVRLEQTRRGEKASVSATITPCGRCVNRHEQYAPHSATRMPPVDQFVSPTDAASQCESRTMSRTAAIETTGTPRY